MSKSLKLSDIIKRDHQEINKLYKNYLISKGNIDDEQHWSNIIQQELIRYLTTEQIILYPIFEKYFHEKESFLSNDQQQMKKLLFILETTSITDPQYRSTLDQLINDFNKHILNEEEIYLTKLENKITFDLNVSLGQSFEQTKHSHHLKVYPTSSINPPL